MFLLSLLKRLNTTVCIETVFCSDGQLNILCIHITLLPAENSQNWIKIRNLKWFRGNKEIFVPRGNNTTIICVTLKSWHSELVGPVGQQVNEGNGINTQGVKRPQGQKQGCCIIRALLTPEQYTRTACFTQSLSKGQIVPCLFLHPGGSYFERTEIFNSKGNRVHTTHMFTVREGC